MKLLVIFVDHVSKRIDLVWGKGLSKVWGEKHKGCLVSIDPKDSSVISLHSINRTSNVVKELRGISSIEQLGQEAKKFMGSFDEEEVIFFRNSRVDIKLLGDQSAVRMYTIVGDIADSVVGDSVGESERKQIDDAKDDTVDVQSAAKVTAKIELSDIVEETEAEINADEANKTDGVEKKQSPSVVAPSAVIVESVRTVPANSSEFKLALDRKKELENELKNCCWFSRTNKTRTIKELDFWKEVVALGVADSQLSLKTAVESIKEKYDTSEDYKKVTHGSWCCKTKSASIINKILQNADPLDEEIELLSPVGNNKRGLQ